MNALQFHPIAATPENGSRGAHANAHAAPPAAPCPTPQPPYGEGPTGGYGATLKPGYGQRTMLLWATPATNTLRPLQADGRPPVQLDAYAYPPGGAAAPADHGYAPAPAQAAGGPSQPNGYVPAPAHDAYGRLSAPSLSPAPPPGYARHTHAGHAQVYPVVESPQGGFSQRGMQGGSLPASGSVMVDIQDLRKVYKRGNQAITVLDGISLQIPEGQFLALMGPSGSGKTTLMNLIAGVDRPSSGRLSVAGTDIGRLSENQLARWRGRNVGFIFQLYNLIPVLNAVENVEVPLLLVNLSRKERRERAMAALQVVGLAGRERHYPRQLSGGQEQRVAIARAIVADPAILVGDEPTGDLDAKSANDILNLLETLNQEFKKTIVMVTHDPRAAARAHVQHHLEKGVLQEARS